MLIQMKPGEILNDGTIRLKYIERGVRRFGTRPIYRFMKFVNADDPNDHRRIDMVLKTRAIIEINGEWHFKDRLETAFKPRCCNV